MTSSLASSFFVILFISYQVSFWFKISISSNIAVLHYVFCIASSTDKSSDFSSMVTSLYGFKDDIIPFSLVIYHFFVLHQDRGQKNRPILTISFCSLINEAFRTIFYPRFYSVASKFIPLYLIQLILEKKIQILI